ncbi:MAG: MarR family winged helix-turn-helix transcriptional regulator [Bryobacteraceae bacterium]
MTGTKVLRKTLSPEQYRQIAEFRYRIRQFLHFSEEVARGNGIEPRQHQLMLAIKGLPEGLRPTITALSERLCLRHHSTVELINRLVAHGAVVRVHSNEDSREILVELTPHGEELLRTLSVLHWEELQNAGPALADSLRAMVHRPTRPKRRSA